MSNKIKDILSVLYTVLIEIPALVLTGICTIGAIFMWEDIVSDSNMILIILNIVCFVLLVATRARETYKTRKSRDYLRALTNVTQFSPVVQVMVKPDIVISYDNASEFYKPYKMRIVDNVSINTLTKSLESIPMMTFMMRGLESPIYIARLCKETTSSIETLVGVFKVKGGYKRYIKDNMVSISDSFGIDVTPIIRDICLNGFEGCLASFSCVESDEEMKYKLLLYHVDETEEK